jgi:cytochrome c biogenesis protein
MEIFRTGRKDAQAGGLKQTALGSLAAHELETGEAANSLTMTTSVAAPAKSDPPIRRNKLAILASVKLTVLLLTLIAATILIGAWCPQESAVGFQKVVDMFGEKNALELSRYGITDIFHSVWFLMLIGLLTANMVACSVQRVFPKARLFRQPMMFFTDREISKLPVQREIRVPLASEVASQKLEQSLRKCGYVIKKKDSSITAEWGKIGKLAATITHIGLLSLLVGVSITSWTGFSGFEPTPLHGSMSFASSEHSKLWVGKLPTWSVRVDATRREDYPTGEPKQWYSDLAVVDSNGRELKKQQISVNNPLSYDGVDIYQSSWGLDQLVLGFNGHERHLDLRQMGKVYAAFLPLDEATILIFSVRDQVKPLRVFGKTPQWESPRLLTEIPLGQSVKLGTVNLTYKELIPITGLQYKSDPGFGVVIVAFCFIMAGVLLAAIPHRQVWAHARIIDEENESNSSAGGQKFCILSVGGRSVKAKTAFEKSVNKILNALENELVPVGDKA